MTYLFDWAEQVINRDHNCAICGSYQNLEAHHIFKVNNYDDAYLDLNNGITLCNKCHSLYHKNYGLDCNLKNLLELKSEVFYPTFGKLKKKYANVHTQMKNLEKRNRDLKKKNRKLRKRLKEYREA